MAINSYAELKTSIAAYLQRSDLTAVIPDFIALAESDINGDIADLPSVHRHDTATTAPNNPIVDTIGVYALRDAWCNGEPLHIGLPSSMTTTSTAKGAPEAIAIEGASAIRVYPIPDAAYAIDLLYVPVISPSLAGGEPSSDATNWILQQFPGAYLYGALLHASAYIEDVSKLGAWQMGYDAAINRLRGANRQGHTTMTASALIGLTGGNRYV